MIALILHIHIIYICTLYIYIYIHIYIYYVCICTCAYVYIYMYIDMYTARERIVVVSLTRGPSPLPRSFGGVYSLLGPVLSGEDDGTRGEREYSLAPKYVQKAGTTGDVLLLLSIS